MPKEGLKLSVTLQSIYPEVKFIDGEPVEKKYPVFQSAEGQPVYPGCSLKKKDLSLPVFSSPGCDGLIGSSLEVDLMDKSTVSDVFNPQYASCRTCVVYNRYKQSQKQE